MFSTGTCSSSVIWCLLNLNMTGVTDLGNICDMKISEHGHWKDIYCIVSADRTHGF